MSTKQIRYEQFLDSCEKESARFLATNWDSIMDAIALVVEQQKNEAVVAASPNKERWLEKCREQWRITQKARTPEALERLIYAVTAGWGRKVGHTHAFEYRHENRSRSGFDRNAFVLAGLSLVKETITLNAEGIVSERKREIVRTW